MEKLIITIAPTGNVPTKEMTPHVPVTAAEIVADVEACFAVGAAVAVTHGEGEDAAHYEIREASELTPSHDVGKNFAKHPGYPEAVADGYYAMYTLRFANKRAASSQVSDNVYQLLHVVFPVETVESSGTSTATTSVFKKLINSGVPVPKSSEVTDKSKTIV